MARILEDLEAEILEMARIMMVYRYKYMINGEKMVTLCNTHEINGDCAWPTTRFHSRAGTVAIYGMGVSIGMVWV